MAGIAVAYGTGANDNIDALNDMLLSIKHRGQGGRDIFTQRQVALGHQARDLGENVCQQPLVTDNEMTALVSDASIYNKEEFYQSSKSEVENLTDADAIMRAYKKFGTMCPKKLDGAFSFVIYDHGKLFAARDPLGILPLYWGLLNGQILFASELKALVGTAERIKEFPPGHYFHSDSGLKKYYDLPSDPPSIKEPQVAAKELSVLLRKAVKKRIQDGIRIGTYLSGGVDSSIITALAIEYCENLKAFSVGMETSEDLHFARLVAKHLDIEHIEFVYDVNDILEVLSEVIYYLESFDAPLVRGSIPNYLVANLAKDEIDLVLVGEGADENFGGYHKLKKLKSTNQQHEAIRDLFKGLHNGECTRVDRMNSSNSLVVGTPFLDKDVVDFAFKLHPSIKIYGKEKIEKWILRKAFEGILPESVTWRPKKQFAQGCGSYNLLIPYAETVISDETFEEEKERYPNVDIRRKEELLYFRIFRDYFGDDPSVISMVRRWYE